MKHPRSSRTAKAAAGPLAIALLTGGLLTGGLLAGAGPAAAGPAAADATAGRAAAPAPCTYTQLVADGAQRDASGRVRITGGGGALQPAPADGGDFALCGGGVRATAFR